MALPDFYYSKRAKALRDLDHPQAWNEQETRDRQLEYWLKQLRGIVGDGGTGQRVLYFHLGSSTGVSERQSIVAHDGILYAVIAHLRGDGSTDTIFDTLVNGTPLAGGTVTLGNSIDWVWVWPNGADGVPAIADIDSAQGDYFQIDVTTVGTDADGLTVQLVFDDAGDYSLTLHIITYTYTGSVQTFSVPANVSRLEYMDVYGGQGGSHGGPGGVGTGGKGAHIHLTGIPVVAGTDYDVYVGGQGEASGSVTHLGGWPNGGDGGSSASDGGGGGGASTYFVATGGVIADAIANAAGGGGCGDHGASGTGYDGGYGGTSGSDGGGSSTTPGLGATPSVPGAGGTSGLGNGSAGTAGQGGAGASHGFHWGGGGGGGGVQGGGGGATTFSPPGAGSGGGGSSATDGSEDSSVITDNNNSGNGLLVLAYYA